MARRETLAIPRRAPGLPVPLTGTQERLWFLDQAGQAASAYLCWAGNRLTGALDEDALQRALAGVVARHEAMRTGIITGPGGRPVQVVHEADTLDLGGLLERAAVPRDGDVSAAREIADAFVTRPFSLDRPPLLRALLVRIAPDDHLLLVCAHHIVCDGPSLEVILEEVYTGPVSLEAPPVQFPDYAAWLAGRGGERLEADRRYWLEQLSGAPALLDLPTDRPRPATPSNRGARHSLHLPAHLAARLQEFAKERRCTPFMVLLAALSVTLARHTGQDDIVVGTPVENRDLAELERSVGMYVNTVALRTRLDGNPTLADVLEQACEVATGGLDHRMTPFEEVVELVAGRRDLSHNPLFQVMLVVEQAARRQVPAGSGLVVGGWPLPVPSARFDVTVVAHASADALGLHLDYAQDLFDEDTMAAFCGHLATVVEALLTDRDRRMWHVPLRAADSSGTATPGEWEPVLSRIAGWAARTPDAPAVIGEHGTLGYGELLRRADQLAVRLRETLGAAGGGVPLVGIVLPTGAEAIVAILGVLRAGAAYLPLDPAHPPARLAALLGEAGADAVIAGSQVAGYPGPHVTLDTASGAAPGHVAAAAPGDLAYVIYTSGSTGSPKGVMVTHGTLDRLTRSFVDAHGFGPGHRLLMLPPLTFDASVGDLFPALTSGAALVLHPEPARLDGGELVRFCREHGVTAVDTAASLWRRWVGDLAGTGVPDDWPVSIMMIGGEEVAAEDVRTWQRLTGGRGALYNHYGPTEATVCATVHRIGGTDDLGSLWRVPIGRPLPQVTARVLDPYGGLAPVGVAGELCLGGDCLARGYLGRPGLTADRFSPDPYGAPGSRLYRTGDLARERADGTIEFLGRSDRQVKIRGHRVEPAEVEAAIATHQDVGDAVVIPVGDRLVGYVAPAAGSASPAWQVPEDLRRHLRARLPDYLLPSVLVAVPAIPRTSHGKVDQAALPSPDGSRDAHVPPRGQVESALAGVWARALGVSEVGRTDNFFELGGHSLLAASVVAEIGRVLGVELPLRALLETADLADLAALVIGERKPDDTPDLEAEAVQAAEQAARAVTAPTRSRARERSPATVLVTGATGFLGAHLVAQLMDRTDATVLCLVRAADEREAAGRVLAGLWAHGLDADPARLAGVPGDLAQERFGLAERDFAALAGRTDVVCHNGGRVNFAESYARLRPVNVGGTLEAVRLAALGGARLHVVSSLGVYLGDAHRGRHVTESDPPDDPAGLGTGYDQSKWVADRLARAAGTAGLSVSVHRPARVTGDSRSGRGNEGDYFSRLLATCAQLGEVPDLPYEEDLAPVDYVAAGIAHLIADASAAGDYHYFNGATLSYSTIAQTMGAELVPWTRWRAAVLAGGDDLPLAPFAATLPPDTPVFHRPLFDCSRTEGVLAAAGITCPPADADLLLRYLRNHETSRS